MAEKVWFMSGVKRKFDDVRDSADEEPKKGFYLASFAKERAEEIKALKKNLESTGNNRLVTQLLPRHMRRRATSHNKKRLPRRLQESAEKMYEGRTKSKMPSRKHRRRPKKLLSEYSRRQRNNVWLETHIWHAKRFKMCNKWGYRLPVHPTDKSYRAAYRSTQLHCLMQDISYYCCIELEGPQTIITEALSHLTSSETGPTFSNKGCINGNKEGKITLYKFQQYPRHALCTVTYLWQSLAPGEKLCRKLWIWVHPCSYEECWTSLSRALHEAQNLSYSDQDVLRNKTGFQQSDACDGIEKTSDACDVSVKNVLNRKEVIGQVTLHSLKDSLVRFKLTGPLSTQLLLKVLTPSVLEAENSEKRYWWENYYDLTQNRDAKRDQNEFWNFVKKCSSPGELHPHMVLGLVVRDPRYTMPHLKEKVRDTSNESLSTLVDVEKLKESVQQNLCNSSIWDADIRQEVKDSKQTDNDINSLKSKTLVPGCAIQESQDEVKIPVLVIQNPGCQTEWLHPGLHDISYGSGFDLILPAGWAMPFWVALSYCGARVGGLREMDTICMDSGMLRPVDNVDTDAGAKAADELEKELWDVYQKKPPAKRHNYITLGIKSPFKNPWKDLVNEWRLVSKQYDLFSGSKCFADKESSALETEIDISNSETFFVLRNQKILQNLSSVASMGKLLSKKTVSDLVFKETKLSPCLPLIQVCQEMPQCLVPVRIFMVCRGHPEQFASICIPELHDFRQLSQDLNFLGPLERKHMNIIKTKNKEKKTKKTKVSPDLVSSAVKSVIQGNDRTIIGFINQGGFTQSIGQGSGVGFCSLEGILHTLAISPLEVKTLVLIRNSSTHQYRFAYLQVMKGALL